MLRVQALIFSEAENVYFFKYIFNLAKENISMQNI